MVLEDSWEKVRESETYAFLISPVKLGEQRRKRSCNSSQGPGFIFINVQSEEFKKFTRTLGKISLIGSYKMWLARRSKEWAPGQLVRAQSI